MMAFVSKAKRMIKRVLGAEGPCIECHFGEQDLSSPVNIPFEAYHEALTQERNRTEVEAAILRDIAPYLHRFVGREDRTLTVSNSDKALVWKQIETLFSSISSRVVFSCANKGMGFDHKAALLDRFYDERPPFQKVYVRRVDLERKRLRCQGFVEMPQVLLDGEPLTLGARKSSVRNFLGKPFFYTQEFVVPYKDEEQRLSFAVSGDRPVKIDVNGREFEGATSIGALIEEFAKNWEQYPKAASTWLIMDRDVCADDNGEHFYRYMMAHHPEQHCIFALRKTSVHWGRLEDEGFDLVDYGSDEYEQAVRGCSVIISSHADPYVFSYYRDHFFFSKKFVFLQHGVTKDDISPWLNTVREMDLMITATAKERESIASDGSPYRLLSDEVVLTGFPRHDALLEKNRIRQEEKTASKTLLVVPTWRKYLLGKMSGKGNARNLRSDFGNSEYARWWQEALTSPVVKKWAEEGNRVVFFPHANMAPYVESGQFTVPEYVEYASNEGGDSVQDLFVDADMLLTDYSSVSFEGALLYKPCVYYQFDSTGAGNEGYHFCHGYYDFEKDGFGPVVRTKSELEEHLKLLFDNDCKMTSEQMERANATFAFRDGKCCERVYESILELLAPGED